MVCGGCSRTLAYSPTSHGVEAELDHFEANPPSAPLDVEEAYAVSQMLDAIIFSKDEKTIRRVLWVGEATLEAMATPTPSI